MRRKIAILLAALAVGHAAPAAAQLPGGGQFPPPFEGTGQNPGAPPIFNRPQAPTNLDLRKPVKIVSGRYVGQNQFQILRDPFSVSITAQKQTPPDLVATQSRYLTELFVVDTVFGKPVAGVPMAVVCVSGTCPKNDTASAVSDQWGRIALTLNLGTAGEKVVTGLQASGDKFKSAVTQLTYDATTVPTKGMICVVNLTGGARPYSDQFAAILYETLEQSGFPLLDRNVASGQQGQSPVDPDRTLSGAKSAVADLQKRIASATGKMQLASAAGIAASALTLNIGMIEANVVAAIFGGWLSQSGDGSYRTRVLMNGPGENSGWAYLEQWNTDCKIYNPGDAVGLYLQYHRSGSSYYKIADFPVTVQRGHVTIIETHGTSDTSSGFGPSYFIR